MFKAKTTWIFTVLSLQPFLCLKFSSKRLGRKIEVNFLDMTKDKYKNVQQIFYLIAKC